MTEKSFETEYSDSISAESEMTPKSTNIPSPTTTHSSSPEPDIAEYKKWLNDATLFKSQADDYLTPNKVKDDSISIGKPLMRSTTILGESNEYATESAIDLSHNLPVKTFKNSLSVDTLSLVNPSVMSEDKLKDHMLFEKKRDAGIKMLGRGVVTCGGGSLLKVVVDDNTPEKSPVKIINCKIATEIKRNDDKLKQLYKMDWPVLPNEHEMESFEEENREIKRRIGIARGTIKEGVGEGSKVNHSQIY